MTTEPTNPTTSTPPMVEARGVRKSFGHVEILKGVNLRVERGSVSCLIGPSGSGKTTFLRCINHLEKVDAGRLYVNGQLVGYQERNGRLYEMKERQTALSRRTAGMVFQRFNLFPHMTVMENVVEAPLNVLKRPRAEVTAEAQTDGSAACPVPVAEWRSGVDGPRGSWSAAAGAGAAVRPRAGRRVPDGRGGCGGWPRTAHPRGCTRASVRVGAARSGRGHGGRSGRGRRRGGGARAGRGRSAARRRGGRAALTTQTSPPPGAHGKPARHRRT